MYTYRELEIATNNFSEDKKIGGGEYGDVYKGVLNDGTVAAIKKLHMLNHNSSNQKHEDRSFRFEVSCFHFIYCYPFLSTFLCLFIVSMFTTNTVQYLHIIFIQYPSC